MSSQQSFVRSESGSNMTVPRDQELDTILDSINLQLNPQQTQSYTQSGSHSHAGNEVRLEMEQESSPTGDDSSSHGHTHANPSQQDTQPMAILMPYILKFGIFILIILLKILYSHRYGLVILICAMGSWYHADDILTTQITLRGHSRHKLFVAKLLWVITFLSCNLLGVYCFLDTDSLLINRLILRTQGLEKGLEIWTLLWLLIINDYAIKYCTIIIKSLLTLLPKTIVPYQLKGSIYSFLERLTLLYRSILPIVPWYFFLLTSDGPWFSAVLFIMYTVFKFLDLTKQFTPLKTSIVRLVTANGSYGRKPTNGEIEESEGTCPVCHEDYADPIVLGCNHIFCEDCVLVWFDKETSCPLCRAKIVTGDNTFRDGSSSNAIQFF